MKIALAPAPSDARSFHAERRSDLRATPPWHQLAYIARALPRVLEDLSRQAQPPAGGRVLDYGCADLPYRGLFGSGIEFVGADLPGNPHASIELRPDSTLPIDDESFDVVLSTQVLEHVADPGVYLAEAHRVLRPGGRLLLSTHGVFVYHPDPVDLWRWTGDGLRRAVEGAGFRVVRFEGVIGLVPTGLQLVQDAVYWKLPRPLRPPFALVLQSLMALTDRRHTPESKARNASVFALVAERG